MCKPQERNRTPSMSQGLCGSLWPCGSLHGTKPPPSKLKLKLLLRGLSRCLAEVKQCLREPLCEGLWGGGLQPQLFLEQLPDGRSIIPTAWGHLFYSNQIRGRALCTSLVCCPAVDSGGALRNLLSCQEKAGSGWGQAAELFTPALTSRKVILSKPCGVLLSAGVLLPPPRRFIQYHPPAAARARVMMARRRLSTTSATGVPDDVSAGRRQLPGLTPPVRRSGFIPSTLYSPSQSCTFC